jgi:hypothetical protein
MLCVLTVVLTAGGCAPAASTMTAANVLQPVLVGKVARIGGTPSDKTGLYRGRAFTGTVTNEIMVAATPVASMWATTTQGSNIVDKQLIPALDFARADSGAVAVIDSLMFRTRAGFWLFFASQGNYGLLYGSKYHTKPTEPEDLVIPSSVELPLDGAASIMAGRIVIKCTKRRDSPFVSSIIVSVEGDGATEIDKEANGSFQERSLVVKKGSVFYIRSRSLLLRADFVRETDRGVELALQRR